MLGAKRLKNSPSAGREKLHPKRTGPRNPRGSPQAYYSLSTVILADEAEAARTFTSRLSSFNTNLTKKRNIENPARDTLRKDDEGAAVSALIWIK
jgi:hypothetical protein